MASPPATAIKCIPSWIKLAFPNSSNLKTDIQNRISDKTEINFITALHDMKGDNKSGDGVSFSEITLLAMAFFIDKIFIDKLKDEHYTLDMIKGFLDANNLTAYTAIHEIDVEFFRLQDHSYLRHCWLIIQTAWFFNSEHFGKHQHIDYLNHYSKTGFKLPFEHYLFDSNYLNKKYLEIDQNKQKSIVKDGFNLVGQWYHAILFLICNELHLSKKHFKLTTDENREYNPLTKTSRQLRPLMPFKVIECDIKSAFPTFLDIETGAKIKGDVYNNVMLSKGITRDKAKILFNTMCNSGAYHCKEETKAFLLDCGYTVKQSEIITALTHDRKRKFFSYMTEYESLAISKFVILNGLQRGTRLHDSLIFINDKIQPVLLDVELVCDFGYKELNKPIIIDSFKMSDKRIKYAHISSIPQGLKLISKQEGIKPDIRGEANGFRFFEGEYCYISAGFNLNNYQLIHETFLEQCEIMFSKLLYLNKQRYSNMQLIIILRHIRENSNIVFNVRAMYYYFKNYQINTSFLTIKTRDFIFVSQFKFQTSIEFLIALNIGRGMITTKENHLNLLKIIGERISNKDYEFIDEIQNKGKRKKNILAISIRNLFNLLACNKIRKSRKSISAYPLYNYPIKSVLINSISSPTRQHNANIVRSIKKYEKELLAFNKLINNREKIKQLFLILCDINSQTSNLNIIKDELIQQQIKSQLIAKIDGSALPDISASTIEFDRRYVPKSINVMKVTLDIDTTFSADMKNSIFNQMTMAEANCMGESFFQQYLKFHGEGIVDAPTRNVLKKKEVYILPQIDFDASQD